MHIPLTIGLVMLATLGGIRTTPMPASVSTQTPTTAPTSTSATSAAAPTPAGAQTLAPASTPTAVDEASIEHLPEAIRNDITAWRQRLAAAKCLKVVTETDETWASLREVDENGSPKIRDRERFSIHSWMTPDDLWVVIYPYAGDQPDTAKPLVQIYWSAKEGRVWERQKITEADSPDRAYRDRSYKTEEDEIDGPHDVKFGAKGCIYAGSTASWLAGLRVPSERQTTTAHSMSLMRRPQLPMVPADPGQPGYWLDVFSDTPRNEYDADRNKLYRRSDHMLMARDAQGRPEVRQWRTIVTTDNKTSQGTQGGRITAIRRFAYTFFDRPPAELQSTKEKFRASVEATVRKEEQKDERKGE